MRAKALHHLARARALDPASPRYAHALGKALLMAADPAGALPHLIAGGTAEPSPSAHFLRAAACYFSGDPRSAEIWATAAIGEGPLFVRASALRGEAREALGDRDGSLSDWALVLESGAASDYLRLKGAARSLAAAFRSEGAERMRLIGSVRDLLVEGLPGRFRSEHRLLLGFAFFELEEPRRAAIHLSRADGGGRADCLLRLGAAEMMTGHGERGCELLARVVPGGGPEGASASEILERYRSGRAPVPGPGGLPPPDLDGLLPFALDAILPGAAASPDPAEAYDAAAAAEASRERSFAASRRRAGEPLASLARAAAEKREAPAGLPDASAAEWERGKARDLLETARERLAEGREDLAAATFCRAFDVLDRPGPSGPELDGLRVEILLALAALADSPGVSGPLTARAARCLAPLGQREPAAARRMIRLLIAGDGGLLRLTALVSAVEAAVPLDRELAASVHRTLADGLHVRMNATARDILEKLGLLERLHLARPELGYPRLYLARVLTLEGRYGEARDLLAGIRGGFADRTRVLNLRGRCAEMLGLDAEAEQLFLGSLARNGDQADIHFRVGRLALDRLAPGRVRPAFRSAGRETARPAGRDADAGRG